MTLRFNWYRDTVFAGGGKKLPKPEEQGYIMLNENGSLDVCPDDDYYNGKVSAADARALALAILGRSE